MRGYLEFSMKSLYEELPVTWAERSRFFGIYIVPALAAKDTGRYDPVYTFRRPTKLHTPFGTQRIYAECGWLFEGVEYKCDLPTGSTYTWLGYPSNDIIYTINHISLTGPGYNAIYRSRRWTKMVTFELARRTLREDNHGLRRVR